MWSKKIHTFGAVFFHAEGVGPQVNPNPKQGMLAFAAYNTPLYYSYSIFLSKIAVLKIYEIQPIIAQNMVLKLAQKLIFHGHDSLFKITFTTLKLNHTTYFLAQIQYFLVKIKIISKHDFII